MKIILKIFLIFSLLFGVTYILNVNAEGEVLVVVTEKIPGANCNPIDSFGIDTQDGEVCQLSSGNFTCIGTQKYQCSVGKGVGAIVQMMGRMVKYFTFIAGLTGVLFIVVNGIMYSMGGMDQGMKDESKKRITKTILGLILLLLSGVFLKIVAPWVYL